MADSGAGSSGEMDKNNVNSSAVDPLKLFYPAVNEDETSLPRSWSPKDKYNFIGLSQNNLRVHYKGTGKTHKDAASVRATHPIPAACGLYYFEVKIVSKGRDGYMGIGLSAQGVNNNRLPGWDKHSYGYHGDDGHSFCSSGTGQPYGPTFTTGDVIGCGVNLIDNTCFYTKNGHNLGIAFTDLPPNLYPTVGLQTPGEVVDANFGQSPFVFDITDMMKEMRARTRHTIERFPVADSKGEWQTTLQRIVSTYLVHHGYCATAESFARSTGQSFDEELASIKSRQRIQKLVLAGRMGEAIETTKKLYPGLLERNSNLLFMLKVRQFIEMVNGTDSEVKSLLSKSVKASMNWCNPQSLSPNHSLSSSTLLHKPSPRHESIGSSSSSSSSIISNKSTHNEMNSSTVEMNVTNSAHIMNGAPTSSSKSRVINDDEEDDMDIECQDENSIHIHKSVSNGSTHYNMNGSYLEDEEMDTQDTEHEPSTSRRQLCGGSPVAIKHMLQFGRELQAMSVQLKRKHGKNESNKKMLQDAFSLLAYSDPWSSPVGFQLDQVQREPICAALNSSILESHNLPRQPPLELALGQAISCVKLMSKVGLGSCAFASVEDYLH
ncbi:ran-binding protein 9 [Saccoglossus kowalevskii]|uniref:Ran-binding protein 9 n=1 Tax=Saccoglossus kowalevskii TaxID=10224 RepID=A0ABM0GX53_SACKO|nr:PREDICTED: ran-binding protein 9 [Saccoglossus kowalevskii]